MFSSSSLRETFRFPALFRFPFLSDYLAFCNLPCLFLCFFISIVSHVSEESHQSSACFRFFLRLACFEYSLLASEGNEEDREVSLLVLLSEACSESPHLSDPSAIFLHEPATDQSPYDFGQREQIQRDKLRMILMSASQARHPFAQQYSIPLQSEITDTRTRFQTCDFFLQESTPHCGNLNSTTGRNNIFKTTRCHGGQNSTREGKITHQVGFHPVCDRGVSYLNIIFDFVCSPEDTFSVGESQKLRNYRSAYRPAFFLPILVLQ